MINPRFQIGEKVYVKEFHPDDVQNTFTVDSIIIDKYGTWYFLLIEFGGILRIKESELEGEVQK